MTWKSLSCSGRLLAAALLMMAASQSYSAQRTFDFNSSEYGLPDTDCSNNPTPPMFNRPEYGSQTADLIVDPAGCGEGIQDGINNTEGSDSYLTATLAASGNSDRLTFSWEDPTDTDNWARVVTFNAGGVTPLFPEPTMHVGVGSKISMKIALAAFDDQSPKQINPNAKLQFALAFRETGQNLPLGEPGGSGGAVEFLGIDSTTPGTNIGLVPVGGVELPFNTSSFTTLEWTIDSPTQVTVTVNGANPQVKSVVDFAGNGELCEAGSPCETNLRGILDSLVLIKSPNDSVSKKWFVWVDDVVIDSGAILDPVAIEAPVLESATEVKVKFVDPTATAVTLYEDSGGGPVVLAGPVNPGGASEVTFGGLDLSTRLGNILTATQTIGGNESDPSAGVPIVSAVAWSENFDSYADQTAFAAAWPKADGDDSTEIVLSSAQAASCSNSSHAPISAVGSGDPNRRFQNFSTPLDGSDTVPLWFTAYFYHEAGSNQRNWIEFNRYASGGFDGGFPSTLIAFGNYNGLAGATSDYVVRDALSWIDTDIPRINNAWNKLQIRVDSSTTEYYVNDVLALTRPKSNSGGFTTVILGAGLTSNQAAAWWDNLSISLGPAAIDPFGPPLPVPTVAGPLTPTASPTTVTVNDLETTATTVNVYADDTLIGSESLSAETTKVVNVSSIPNNAVITATQVLPGGESCRSASSGVVAAFPAPTVQAPIDAGATTVTVTDLDANVQEVTVYVNDTPVLPPTNAVGLTEVDVTVPALINGDQVQATQTIDGFESAISTPPVTVFTQGIGPILLSLGVREVSGQSGPVGADGGTSGDLEWIGSSTTSSAPNGKQILPGPNWQQVTFDPLTDDINAMFTGNGILDGPSAPWYVMESLGITIDQTDPKPGPYTLYIDDIESNGVNFGDFEAYTPPTAEGTVIFRNPTFSGSSSSFLASEPDASFVTDEQARTGSNSLKVEWAWLSDSLSSWFRFTTFNVTNQGNPLLDLSQPVTLWVLLCGAPEVSVGNILVDGGDTVTVTGVSLAADSVQVYADGNPTPIGSAPGNGTDTVDVTGLTLTAGQEITVTQTLGGAEGCTGAVTIVDDCTQVAEVGVGGPLVSGDSSVTVTGIDPDASLVKVYVVGNATPIGSLAPVGVETLSVPVTPNLAAGQQIVATQTLSGLEGCVGTSGPVVGSGSNGALRIALGIREPDSAAGDDLEWVGATGTAGGPPAPTQTVAVTSGWQTLTFDGSSLVQQFTGDGIVDPGTVDPDIGLVRIDHLAITRDAPNTDTGPYTLYIDEIKNGSTSLQGFESGLPGDEVWFQEPSFSGTTDGFLLSAPNVSEVDDTQADVGTQSYRVEWQFAGDDPDQWLRLVTSGSPLQDISVDLTQTVTIRVLLLPSFECNDPFADADGDGDADAMDFAFMQQCFTDLGQPLLSVPGYDCGCFDRDNVDDTGTPDGSVTIHDFDRFSECAGGPNLPTLSCGP